MKRVHKFAPSPAMVVACLALMVALGGVGYAATALPRNSVGTPQLKRNAVTSVKVKDRSLLARDFRRGQLPRGPRGLRGLTGATGAQGPPGAPNPNAANSELLDGLDSPIYLSRAWSTNDIGPFSNQTVFTTIASVNFSAPAACNLIMSGTLDWDDNAGANILFVQWFVDGAAVGGDFAFQGGGTGNNFDATAIASKAVAAGAHTVELKARVSTGSADLEDLGAYAFCALRDAAGAPVTPTVASTPTPAAKAKTDTTQ
jgi:hypothetical protein